ncbi:hypothetical protein PY093_18025 [Cytobacillus sp. S13-E01]|uniref:hypothetical protein n=1 Tax=Cytobacillus sp. S13-E01 TaxID=3031326 RepID=UPI0023D85E81|nr:hypothetical protein [Cytobacillus sp. S13-E01]MDF0728535.1 hypothetical protein [Cytobacillus sp. S13-E01]
MLEKEILIELQEYVELHLSVQEFNLYEPESIITKDAEHNELEDFITTNRKPTFAQVLLGLIDDTGYSDSDIYKKAGIDRRHFSKIRSNSDYRPGKNSAVALALALELNKKETDKLLSSAGFSLSDSDTFDLVIQFCLEKRIYDLDKVNQALDYFSVKLLSKY